MSRKTNDKRVSYELSFDRDEELLAFGAIIPVKISVTESALLAGSVQGKEYPLPVECKMIIDTGSNVSYIQPEIALSAGLRLMDKGREITLIDQNKGYSDIYYGDVIIEFEKVKGSKRHEFWFLVSSMLYTAKMPQPKKYQGLIGRDILKYFELKINGSTGLLSLKYKGVS